MWPTNPDADPAGLAEIGRDALNVSDPVVVGHPPTTSVEVERIDDNTSRITVHDARGGNETYRQTHGPQTDDDELVTIRPEQLQPSVHVLPSEPHRILQIYGPPGAFDANGTTPGALISSFADGVGLPSMDGSSAGERSFVMEALRGACFTQDGGSCTGEAEFRLRCGDCDQRTYVIRPTPGQELAETAEFSVGGHSNLVRFHIRLGSPERPPELVAVELPLAFDLNVSEVVTPDEAGETIVDAINESGYEIAEYHHGETRSGLEGLGGVSSFLMMENRSLRPTGGMYHSAAKVTDSGQRYGDTYAKARVDMETGELANLTFRPLSMPSGHEGGDQGNDSPDERPDANATNETPNASNASSPTETPAAGWIAVATSLAAASAALARHRDGG
jgi:hypothetical protein